MHESLSSYGVVKLGLDFRDWFFRQSGLTAQKRREEAARIRYADAVAVPAARIATKLQVAC